MKVTPLAIVALLMASPLAIVALESLGVGPAFEAEAPSWESGHTWTWEVTGRGRAVGEGFGLLRYESDTFRVDATRRAEVMNTSTELNGQSLDLLLEAFRIDRIQNGDDLIYEGKNGSGPPDGGGFGEQFFCITPCGTLLATYDDNANPTFGTQGAAIPGQDNVQIFDFPLTRGKTWMLMSVQEDVFHFEVEAKVVDNEYLNLPGFAPMQTVRIEAAVTEASKDAIRQLVGEEAGRGGLKVDLDFDLRATYWYAPQVQNLVKLDLDGFILGHASGYGAAGAGRLDFHLDQVLQEYSLDAVPERTVEEAHALLGVTESAQGTPVITSPELFDFQVGASALSVHADADQRVRFGVVTGEDRTGADDAARTKFDAPPRGSQVHWTHLAPGPEGTVTTTHAGDHATFEFDGPGLHVVRADVYDQEGRLMGTDRVVVEAYTSETTRLPAGSLPGTSHLVHELYVAPGARSGVVTITPEAAVRGTLHIGQGEDAQHEPVETVSEPVQVLIGDLSRGDTAIVWEDGLRAGGIKATVEVRYDRSVPETGEEAADPAAKDGPGAFFGAFGFWPLRGG